MEDDYNPGGSNVEIKMDLWLKTVFVLQLQSLFLVKYAICKHVLKEKQQNHDHGWLEHFDHVINNVEDEHKPERFFVKMKMVSSFLIHYVLHQNQQHNNPVMHNHVLLPQHQTRSKPTNEKSEIGENVVKNADDEHKPDQWCVPIVHEKQSKMIFAQELNQQQNNHVIHKHA